MNSDHSLEEVGQQFSVTRELIPGGGRAAGALGLRAYLVASEMRCERMGAMSGVLAAVLSMVAIFGVAIALLSGLASEPPGAWRGDLLMIAAALCMALCSIWSKLFSRRSGPIQFTAVSMGVGAACLIAISWLRGSFTPVATFGTPQLACSDLSRRLRKCAHILSAGLRAGADHADARRYLSHC
jgi:hypothetical protein